MMHLFRVAALGDAQKLVLRQFRYARLRICSGARYAHLIRGRSGEAKPVRPRLYLILLLVIFLSTAWKNFGAIGSVGASGSVLRRIPCDSQPAELIPCAGKKIPCPVCVGNSYANN